MARRLSYTNFTFAENEAPTTIKFNHLLSLMEKQRLLLGPFAVGVVSTTGYTNTASGIWLEITDDMYDLGGLFESGGTYYTNRKFDIEYQTQTTLSGDYAIWENVEFYSSGGRYVAFLTNTNVYPTGVTLGTGASEISLSGATSNQFYCLRGRWS